MKGQQVHNKRNDLPLVRGADEFDLQAFLVLRRVPHDIAIRVEHVLPLLAGTRPSPDTKIYISYFESSLWLRVENGEPLSNGSEPTVIALSDELLTEGPIVEVRFRTRAQGLPPIGISELMSDPSPDATH